MVKNSFALSYDVDEETGEVTYYADLQGEHHLSRYDSNLTLGAEEAVHSGLGDGIADTKEELAKFLDLDEWVEYDTFGEEAAKNWWATMKEFEEVGSDLQRQAQGDVDGNNTVGTDDLLAVIAAWGSSDQDADVNGDNVVGTDDLLALIANWGDCS